MDAAGHLVPTVEPGELLPWADICARYPDQFVCLVDVMMVEPRSPTIATGRVIGHGLTRREAFDPIRADFRYATWTVVFTGKPSKPLRQAIKAFAAPSCLFRLMKVTSPFLSTRASLSWLYVYNANDSGEHSLIFAGLGGHYRSRSFR